MTTNKATIHQICAPEFVEWLKTTSFSGIVQPGDQWDTEDAWPSENTMRAARRCFALFSAGMTSEAEEAMWEAQRAFI